MTIHGVEIPSPRTESEKRREFLQGWKSKAKLSMEEIMARALYVKGALTMVVNFKVVNEAGKFIPVKGQGILFKKIPSSGRLLGIVKAMREAAVREVRNEGRQVSTDEQCEKGIHGDAPPAGTGTETEEG